MDKALVKLILVEDDAGHERLAMKESRRSGLVNQVELCRHGGEAVERLQLISCKEAAQHLILLDLNLPVLDGYGVLKETRKRFCLEELPVIILSTTMNAQELERCHSAGSNATLTKPLCIKALTQRLHGLELGFCSTLDNGQLHIHRN